MIDKKKNKQIRTNRQTDRQTDRQTNRQTNKQTNRQTSKQTDRRTDIRTDTGVFYFETKLAPLHQTRNVNGRFGSDL